MASILELAETQSLELADVEQIVRLLDRATDPSKQLLIPDRRRLLIEGLVRLVDADMWIWSMTAMNHERPGDVMTTCAMDGGWHSAAEQHRAYEILSSPDFNTRGLKSLYLAITEGRRMTAMNGEIFPPEEEEALSALWQTTGFENLLLAVHPLTGNFASNLGIHRRKGKPKFTERDRAVVNALFHEIDWLHHYGVHEDARKPVVQLSPRERQALILFLSGCTNGEIARRMKITSHTVKDYVRRVHKRFGVNSRAELQAYFFVGTSDGKLREIGLEV